MLKNYDVCFVTNKGQDIYFILISIGHKYAPSGICADNDKTILNLREK